MTQPRPGQTRHARAWLPVDFHRRVRGPRLIVRAGVVLACLALIGFATPAGASSTSHGAGSGAPAATSPVDPSLVAGYLSTPDGGLASASLRFKVPTVKCGADEPSAVTIGLGDVRDLAAPQVRAHAILNCPTSGPAEATFAVQACTHFAGPLATKHGHRISVSLAQSGGMITVTATDEKDGTTVTATDSTANCAAAGDLDSVLFGAFPVFHPDLLDVPEFSKVKSIDTRVNGLRLSGDKLDRQTSPGITTSQLLSQLSTKYSSATQPSGDSFALRYRGVVHCC